MPVAATAAAPARFDIVAGESRLVARARSSLHPLTYAGPVSGHAEACVESGRIDLSDGVLGRLRIDIATLRGANPASDVDEMRRRLEVARYPTAGVELTGATAKGNDLFEVYGIVELHGRTQHVAGRARVVVEGDRLITAASIELDLRDFGIELPRLLGMRVHPEVEVSIEVLAIRQLGRLVQP